MSKKVIALMTILILGAIFVAVGATAYYVSENQLSPEDSSAAVRVRTSRQTDRTPVSATLSYPEKGFSLSFPTSIGPKEQVFCTQDVMLCPDGRYSSRDPENGCAFRPCGLSEQVY